jgi:hypothetical protein
MFVVGVLNSMIEEYPEFSSLAVEQRPLLYPRFQRLAEGMSELTFAGIYLFRDAHHYRISLAGEDVPVIAGTDAEPFFMLPFELPSEDILSSLFDRYSTMKAVSLSQAQRLSQMGCRVWEDRDNFDYLYAREKLATLSGRKLHRKKNLVNLFLRNNMCTAKPLLEEYADDALHILEQWRLQQETSSPAATEARRVEDRGPRTKDGAAFDPPSAIRNHVTPDPDPGPQSRGPGDYAAAKEAIENMEVLQLCGGIFYVDDEPVAYTLGEELAQGRVFVIHFEKAVLRKEHAGVYQYVNQAFAAVLPDKYKLINREQDLGDPGLPQAKESYRPVGFVKKYRAARP